MLVVQQASPKVILPVRKHYSKKTVNTFIQKNRDEIGGNLTKNIEVKFKGKNRQTNKRKKTIGAKIAYQVVFFIWRIHPFIHIFAKMHH